mgnify:CR=1 FL=1
MVTYILLGIVGIALLYGIVIYNGLVNLKHNVSKSWSNIDVLLRQRHEELPKLVETCKQYMQFERDALERVMAARSGAQVARENGDVVGVGKSEGMMRAALGSIQATVEAYPELKANQSIQTLLSRVTALENAISDRREFYNESVNLNNVRIEQFPDVVVARLLGVDRFLEADGSLNLNQLLVFCAIFGFGGSFISLAMSKWIALKTTGAQVIEQPRNSMEMWLMNTVRRQAQAAGIGMPDVAVYDAPEPNAFATGANKNKALVAVSTGLLRNMTQDEVEAVLGHEVAHVANGDMVTLTLIQGVLNTFVMFLSRVIGHVLDRAVFKTERGYGPGYFISVLVLQIVFGILASAVVAWFSRQREFRADAGGAHLAGRRKMIAALERLKGAHGQSTLPEQMAAFGISGGVRKLFSTHPPLEERIAALQQAETAAGLRR